MEQSTFLERFTTASERARSFAQEQILEELPSELLFTVKLNQSYDGNPLHEDERVFPEDNGREVVCHSCEEVIALLCRDSAVPEWVNVAVYFTDGEKTFIEVLCCGRFTKNEELLYHEQEGYPPFHVLGPSIPPGDRQPGERFSLFWLLDLPIEKLSSFAYPERVTSLHLQGAGASSKPLAALQRFSELRHVSFKGTELNDEALSACAGLVELDGLNIEGTQVSDHGLVHLSRLRALTSLSLSRTQISDVGVRALDQLSSLWSLDLNQTKVTGKTLRGAYKDSLYMLSAIDSLFDDSGCQSLERFTALNHLDLKNTKISSGGLSSLAKLETLKTLDISGTQVNDLEALLTMSKLRRLWLRGSLVSPNAVERLALQLPKLHIDLKKETT